MCQLFKCSSTVKPLVCICVCSVTHQSCRGTTFTAAITADMCLGQDNLTELISLQGDLEVRAVLLIYKLKELTLPCPTLPWSCLLQEDWVNVKEQELVGI